MPADLATLSALKARVEAATGPDHGLWLEIVLALLDPAGMGEPALRLGTVMMSDGPSLFGDGTESIDPALALFDRALPRWSREVGRSGFGNPAWCRAWNPMLSPGEGNTIRADHDCGSEPLAILSALLTAKIAQLEVDHAR